MEQRKDVIGYEGLYQVSDLGRVKSLYFRGTKKEGSLSIQKDKDGYNIVGLRKDNKQTTKRVGRLKAIAFLDNPLNLPQINHKDGNRGNDGLFPDGSDNLERCTYGDNQRHSYKELGRKKLIGGLNPFVKSTFQFTKDGEFIKKWDSVKDIERELGITNQNISKVCNGSHKTAGGFIWKHTLG